MAKIYIAQIDLGEEGIYTSAWSTRAKAIEGCYSVFADSINAATLRGDMLAAREMFDFATAMGDAFNRNMDSYDYVKIIPMELDAEG